MPNSIGTELVTAEDVSEPPEPQEAPKPHRLKMGWINVWKTSPEITGFKLWKFYRSHFVFVCFIASLGALLFSGTFHVEKAGEHLDIDEIKQNLLIASILMGMHAVYLALMLYHLVYRHPVEMKRWLAGIAFFFIAASYVMHGLHDGFSENVPAWLSPAGFFAAYCVMAGEGWIEVLSRHHHEKQRAAAKARSDWMRGTDLFMTLLMFFMVWFEWHAEGSGSNPASVSEKWHSHVEIIRGWVERRISGIPFVHNLFGLITAKDCVIFAALSLYLWARRARPSDEIKGEELHLRVVDHQDIDSSDLDLSRVRPYVKKGMNWMELKCEQGKALWEILHHLKLDREILHSLKICSPAGNAKVNRKAKERLKTAFGLELEFNAAPNGIYSEETVHMLQRSQIIHVSHAAYTIDKARNLVFLLSQANPGTVLFLRFTSPASYFRVISASMSCAPLWTYTHHVMGSLIVEDLKKQGWEECSKQILKRHCRAINKAEARDDIANWAESQYGEFSGDVIKRYFKAFGEGKETTLINSDWLYVFTRKA